MLGTMIFAMFAFAAATVALVCCLMWVARRWVNDYVAVCIGMVAVVWFVQNLIRGIVFCGKSEFIPPEPGSGGDGKVVFNCDGPGGVLDNLYLYYVGPTMVVVVIWFTWRFAQPLMTEGHHGRSST